MRLLRRILITSVIPLAIIFVGITRITPVVLSFYAVTVAPPIARIVPINLQDKSVSSAPGTSLSYLGYQFEIPWNDLDETQTKFYPKDKLEKTKVDLRFRSGLRLLISVHPPGERAKEIPVDLNVSPKLIESAFGQEILKSDYSFVKALYEFSPDNMNPWTASLGTHDLDEVRLMGKSLVLPKAAETGIFNLQNQTFKGFQEGNPRVHQDEIVVDLYSDGGSDVGTIEIKFFQADYQNFAGVTQPEINRIVHSLRKDSRNEIVTPHVAKK